MKGDLKQNQILSRNEKYSHQKLKPNGYTKHSCIISELYEGYMTPRCSTEGLKSAKYTVKFQRHRENLMYI